MAQDATELTKLIKDEKDFWTPCIYRFLETQPALQLPVCTCVPEVKHPPYFRRSRTVALTGQLFKEIPGQEFLRAIDSKLASDRSVQLPEGDVSGITPDLAIVNREEHRYLMIENKPFDHSRFDGNQGPCQSYPKFVKWLRDKKVNCEYLVIAPVGMNSYLFDDLCELQRTLKSAFRTYPPRTCFCRDGARRLHL